MTNLILQLVQTLPAVQLLGGVAAALITLEACGQLGPSQWTVGLPQAGQPAP